MTEAASAGVPAASGVVDAHAHFWDPGRLDYFWLSLTSGPLFRPFLPTELEPALGAAGVSRVVFVQASHDRRENAWALGLAERHPWIAGILGWVNLEDPKVPKELDALVRSASFKGVRHLAHTERDERWLLRPAVANGLAALCERGLAFDLVVKPRQLPLVAELAAAHPKLEFVLDHLGNPPLESGGLDGWARDLALVAARPNVSAKVSGLTTLAGPSAVEPVILAEAVRTAVESFGFERLMFGGDWPVCLKAGSYLDAVSATCSALGDFNPSEGAAFWGGTAARVYRLDPV